MAEIVVGVETTRPCENAQHVKRILIKRELRSAMPARWERRWVIVADEEDARRLGEPRGSVYTADELRRLVQIGDPATVLEIHEWKRRFDARLREYQARKGGA